MSPRAAKGQAKDIRNVKAQSTAPLHLQRIAAAFSICRTWALLDHAPWRLFPARGTLRAVQANQPASHNKRKDPKRGRVRVTDRCIATEFNESLLKAPWRLVVYCQMIATIACSIHVDETQISSKRPGKTNTKLTCTPVVKCIRKLGYRSRSELCSLHRPT